MKMSHGVTVYCFGRRVASWNSNRSDNWRHAKDKTQFSPLRRQSLHGDVEAARPRDSQGGCGHIHRVSSGGSSGGDFRGRGGVTPPPPATTGDQGKAAEQKQRESQFPAPDSRVRKKMRKTAQKRVRKRDRDQENA